MGRTGSVRYRPGASLPYVRLDPGDRELVEISDYRAPCRARTVPSASICDDTSPTITVMQCDEVTDFHSFLAFVDWLAADRAAEVEKEQISPGSPWDRGAHGWENTSIESFLEAACACARDHLSKQGKPPEATWREFACFLYGGKIYE
jgi:hypothetical protein